MKLLLYALKTFWSTLSNVLKAGILTNTGVPLIVCLLFNFILKLRIIDSYITVKTI